MAHIVSYNIFVPLLSNSLFFFFLRMKEDFINDLVCLGDAPYIYIYMEHPLNIPQL